MPSQPSGLKQSLLKDLDNQTNDSARRLGGVRAYMNTRPFAAMTFRYLGSYLPTPATGVWRRFATIVFGGPGLTLTSHAVSVSFFQCRQCFSTSTAYRKTYRMHARHRRVFNCSRSPFNFDFSCTALVPSVAAKTTGDIWILSYIHHTLKIPAPSGVAECFACRIYVVPPGAPCFPGYCAHLILSSVLCYH